MMQVRHDAFARGGLDRRVYDGPTLTCTWCGQKRFRLYTYINDRDDRNTVSIRLHTQQRPFCNLSCYDAYNS